MKDIVAFAPLLFPLQWQTDPLSFSIQNGILHASAGEHTDRFVPPGGEAASLNAPALLGEVSGDFQLQALITPAFRSTFDAGALLVWCDEREWGKLCFEFSPQGEPMVVSVVTRGRSDDANAFVVSQPAVWLRIARLGQAFAFHASLDGQHWDLIRHFPLAAADRVQVGFVVQSPTGEGCSASFAQVGFKHERLANLRDGS